MTLTLDHVVTLAEAAEIAGQMDDRIEVDGGRITVMAPPDSQHAALVTRLAVWLVTGGHPPEHVLAGAGLAVGVNSGRCPDLMLLTEPVDPTVVWIPPIHVRLAVEVVSRGTQDVDRTTKLREYAQVGIPNYWVVEKYADPAAKTGLPTVFRHSAGNGRYRPLGPVPLSDVLAGPVPYL